MNKQHILIVAAALAILAFWAAALWQTWPRSPDAMVSGIKVFAEPGCDAGAWADQAPQLLETFVATAAEYDLAISLLNFNGTAVVLRPEPWVDSWGRKVAGIASYRRGIEVVCGPPHESALAREWVLMLTCNMGGDEDYETVCLTSTMRAFISAVRELWKGEQ